MADLLLTSDTAARAAEARTADPRRRLPLVTLAIALVVTTLVAAALVLQATRPVGADTTDAEDRFVELINELRRDEGLGELTVDLELVAGAETWTERLVADGELSHAPDLSVGVTSYWLKLGENVGVAPQDQIEALFDAFVASPDHYANLVDPDFAYVGVAVLYDDNGRMWTTHRFMELGEDPAPTPVPTAPPTTESAAEPAETTTTPVPAETTVPAALDVETEQAAPATVAPAASTGAELMAATAPLDTDAVAGLLELVATR